MKSAAFSRAAALVAALLFWSAASARAGLTGQPKPSDETATRLRAAARQFTIDGGDVGKARPDLILLIEKEPTADVADLLAPALGDDGAYSSVVQTLADALEERKGDEKARNFIHYTLARVHLYRARFLTSAPAKRPVYEAAANAARQIPEALRDWNAWDLRGDIEAERGDPLSAATAYKRMRTVGGSQATADYKTALAMHRGGRYPEARAAYESALRADAAESGGGRRLYHFVNIGLAGLAQGQGNDPLALQHLTAAAKAKPDASAPFRFDLNVARRLLQRGYGAQVQAYAEAALKFAPDDEDARQLIEQAKAAPRRR